MSLADILGNAFIGAGNAVSGFGDALGGAVTKGVNSLENLNLSPAAGFQAGSGLITSLHKPIVPAVVGPIANPYNSDSAFQMQQQLQRQNLAQEQGLANTQQALMMSEASRNAAQKAREVIQFRSQQALAYDGSGVRLQGTPLLVLEQTRQLGQQEIDAATQSAMAHANIAQQQQSIVQNQGNAQLLDNQMQWNNDRNAFNLQQNNQIAQSQITRNTGYSRSASVLSSLGGLLPGFSGTVNRAKPGPTKPFQPLTPDPNFTGTIPASQF